MKQGTGTSRHGDSKVEPRPKAMNPAAVAALGIHKVYVSSKPGLHDGRGFKAPGIASTSHHCGSQGKH
jgi:hypothetical protein